jgi:ABC-2 type transport system ATP-binding protein
VLVRIDSREYSSVEVRREVGSAVSSPTPERLYVSASYAAPASTASDFAVRIDGLTKRFGHVVAVDDLNLTVPRGEVFGFLGPNGAGKSTTIRALLGLIRPTAGTATIFGDSANDVRRSHRHLAYVPADVALWPALTGAETLELLANVGPGIDNDYRAQLVTRFQLDLDRPGKAYSTGNRQKVALVAAFATRAPLLVLDEPTSGLDPLMEREFRRCVTEARERGQTIFLSSHQLAEVEAVCDRVAILRAGRLVEVDTIADLRLLRRTVVEVSYHDVGPALQGIAGVSNVERVDGSRVRFSLTGPPTPALRALAAADIAALTMREPTLEEIFLDYYGEASR